MARVLTERGELMRSWLPVALQDSPDHLAVVHSYAKELDRAEAAIETVLAQFFPQSATVLLPVYERLLGLTVAPVGWTEAQRQLAVLSQLARMRSDPAGSTWEANVSRIVGNAGWTYETHDPNSAGSPAPNTIRIHLPFAPSSDRYAVTERLIRVITEAHVDLVLTFTGGFVLDESQLDQEALQ
jgi:hypothetical protein